MPAHRSSFRRDRRQQAARWSLALAVFASAIALGTTHTVVLLVVLAPLTAATWLAWRDSEPVRPRAAATILFWVCVGLTLWTLVQALPLPIGLLRVMAPQTADAWDRALSPL